VDPSYNITKEFYVRSAAIDIPFYFLFIAERSSITK